MPTMEPAEPFDYEQLDPGIRAVVAHLHTLGWTTSDSGDGASKPADERALDMPHVAIPYPAWVPRDAVVFRDAHRLFADLEAYEPGEWRVEASYAVPGDGTAILLALRDRKAVVAEFGGPPRPAA